jgi:hypothetical protein
MLIRAIRFCFQAGWIETVILVGIFTLPLFKIVSPFERYFLEGAILALFIFGYFFRYTIVRNFPRSVRIIRRGLLVIVILCFVVQFAGFRRLAFFSAFPAAAFVMGLQFWAITDDMFEMLRWIAHPLEFGRIPEDIRLWHKAELPWDDGGTMTTKLWMFVCEGETYIGITGPITFSIDDGTFHSLSTDSVLKKYRDWFKDQNIASIQPGTGGSEELEV